MKTLSSIAKELGVSTATVSYVYNNKWKEKRIGEELANKILTLIKEQNIQPSMLGKQLKTGKTMIIGAIMPDLSRPHFLAVLRGLDSVFTPEGYMLLLSNSRLGMTERSILGTMISRGVDGIISVPYLQSHAYEELAPDLARKKIPMLFLDNYLANSQIPAVSTDNTKTSEELVKGLINQGARRIAYIGSDTLQVCIDRFAGYRKALADTGIPFDEKLVCRAMKNENAPLSYMELLLEQNPDAVFAESFLYFEPYLQLLHAKGLRSPERIKLAGFDDIHYVLNKIPEISSSFRTATYALQDGEGIGRRAAEKMLRIIKDSHCDSEISTLPAFIKNLN